jgi:hypothetical protein
MPTIDSLSRGTIWMPDDVVEKIEAWSHFYLHALADFHWREASQSYNVTETLTRLVTTDFISGTEDDYSGPTARLIGMGILPLYVDPENTIVKQIIAKCREKL